MNVICWPLRKAIKKKKHVYFIAITICVVILIKAFEMRCQYKHNAINIFTMVARYASNIDIFAWIKQSEVYFYCGQ